MNKLFIKKIIKSYSSDAFNNPMYAYFFRYGDINAYGYMLLITSEGFMRLREALKKGNEIVYSEE